MSNNNQLFTELFRPKKLENMVLLPRIYEELKNGLTSNVLLQSVTPGCGKSALTEILAQGHDVLRLNASLDNGIDMVREQILPFVSSVSLMSDERKLKVVILEEVDNMSTAAQASLRALLEGSHRNARFIMNCNYIDKLIDPLISRFAVINMTPINHEEEVFLLNGYIKRTAKILDSLKIGYTEESITTFVKASFPDYRTVLKKIQQLYDRGASEITSDMLKTTYDCAELFNLILTAPNPWENYKFLVNNFASRPDDAVAEIGKNFVEYMHTVNPQKDSKIPQCIIAIAEHQNMMTSAIDKFIVLESLVFKLQVLVNS